MWQTKYALAVPKSLEVEMDFRPCSEGDFYTGSSTDTIVIVIDDALSYTALAPNSLNRHQACLLTACSPLAIAH